MDEQVYRALADKLDALPNGFPPTEDGIELRLLATFFTPEEAKLAACLKLPLERPSAIAARCGGEPKEVSRLLKGMSRRELIRRGRTDDGVGYGLMPFVVGIYEGLLGQISLEQSGLFEEYYYQAFGKMLDVTPQVHRVIPIQESVTVDMEVHPYESATTIVENAAAWGVIDCICRKQKAAIGDACDHPLDVCLVLNKRPHIFDQHPKIESLTRQEAHDVLQRSADAGLVHSVSNNQKGMSYICNCCTCSCGILRGMKDLGMANVVARSAFVNTVEDSACIGCEDCVEFCQFDALHMNEEGIVMQVNDQRCVGCGVCIPHCDEEALLLVRRPESEVKAPPKTIVDWGMERAVQRDLDMMALL